jgi:hypothetical protein
MCICYKAGQPLIRRDLQSDRRALREQLQSEQENSSQLKAKSQELQHTFENERIVWLNDKKTLEDTIVDMSMLEKQSEGNRTLRESARQEQEERVKVNPTWSLMFTLLISWMDRPLKRDIRPKSSPTLSRSKP